MSDNEIEDKWLAEMGISNPTEEMRLRARGNSDFCHYKSCLLIRELAKELENQAVSMLESIKKLIG